MPPFSKPLLFVNGKTLIQHAFDHAHYDWNADEFVIIASPDNVKMLTQTLHMTTHARGIDETTRVQWVVQPRPMGVIDAIRRGLLSSHAQRLLILCADNTFRGSVAYGAVTRSESSFIAARSLDWPEAQRFTRYQERSDGGLRIIEATDTDHGDGCWIGPLLLDAHSVATALNNPKATSIARLISLATNDGRTLRPLSMSCEDLGIPEAL